MSKWCEIIEIDGKQVLFQNVFSFDKNEYNMNFIVHIPDFLNPDIIIPTALNNMVLVISFAGDKPFPEEQFINFATEENARNIIQNKIKPYFSKDNPQFVNLINKLHEMEEIKKK